LGEKSGKGFFVYEQGRQTELNAGVSHYLPIAAVREHEGAAELGSGKAPMSRNQVADACLIPMLVEALACLDEQVVDDPVHLDAAFVYGIGFPPFRGGLLRYFSGRDMEALKLSITAAGLPVPANLALLDAFR